MAQRTGGLQRSRHIDLTESDAAGDMRRGVIELRASRRIGPYETYIKPVLDRLGGALLLIVFAPALLLVGAAVTIRLGSPVLLRQDRIGLNGRGFAMYKFRTMLPDRRSGERRRSLRQDSQDRRMTHKSAADPRHTRLGRFLRKWSLDELPQLLNIVKGDMSFVGPRPELAQVVERYEPWQHARHAVRPGLTGLWQVTARGNGQLMNEHTEIDLEYTRRVSLATDLKILLLTIPVLLGLRVGE